MKYKVLEAFADIQDSGHKYEIGDIYPRDGYRPTKARIQELATGANKRGRAVLEEIPEEVKAEPETKEVEKKKPAKKKSTKKK